MPTPNQRSRPRTVVLGAEPDPVTRALIALYLEPHGFDVWLAEDAVQALAALEDGSGGEPRALDAFICSERALREAPVPVRRRLLKRLADVRVVSLLEPGAAPEPPGDGPAGSERLTKPVRVEALLSALQGTRPGSMQAPPRIQEHGADSGPLAGFQELIAEMQMDCAMVDELAVSFLERAPGYLDDIAAALIKGDLDAVGEAAHAMKGMCGNLRFGGLVALTDAMRKGAKAGDAESIKRTLGDLRSELEQVSGAMRERGIPSS